MIYAFEKLTLALWESRSWGREGHGQGWEPESS